MLSLRALLAAPLRQLWQWWLTAMGRLIPFKSAAENQTLPAFWEIIWQPQQQQFLLRHQQPDQQYTAHNWHADDDGILSDDLLTDINAKNRPVYLTVPANWFLQTTIRLPITAHSELAAILHFEIDKRTPFQPEQVYFASFAEPAASGASHFDCQLLLIPRSKLDNLLALLARKGLRPSMVGAESIAKHIPLQSHSAISPAAGFSRFKRQLPYLALISFLMALYVPPYWQQQEIADFAKAVDEMRQAAVALQKQRAAVTGYQADLQFLAAIKHDQQQLVMALETLTGLLPNHTWVERLNVAGNEIVVLGESAEAAQLLPLLDKSDLFASIRFAAPITRNRQSGKDRFHLVLTLAETGATP